MMQQEEWRPRALLVAVLAPALLLLACSGNGDDGGGRSGISTRVPGAATNSAAASATIAAPQVPAAGTPVSTPPASPPADSSPPDSTPSTSTRTATPELTETEPYELAAGLAALAGEHPAEIAFLLDSLEPRCEEDRAALVSLTERTWRHLNETQGVAIPVSSILGRILQELPPGTSTHPCEPLMAAVIVALRGR